MMAELQKTYADEPDFTMLLYPCNQFLNQEPHANDVVEKFASGYLNLTDHTVKMFAKSDVNGPCSTSKSDACAADSESCCPANNDIYSYLQSVVPGKCSWNFNKYVVGRDGKPYNKRWGDEDLADALTPVIDQLLKAK